MSIRHRNMKQKNKPLKIEFVQYDGADAKERLEKGMDLLAELLLREYKRLAIEGSKRLQ